MFKIFLTLVTIIALANANATFKEQISPAWQVVVNSPKLGEKSYTITEISVIDDRGLTITKLDVKVEALVKNGVPLISVKNDDKEVTVSVKGPNGSHKFVLKI